MDLNTIRFWDYATSLKFEDNLFDANKLSNRSELMVIDDQKPDHYGQWDLSSIKNWIQNTK